MTDLIHLAFADELNKIAQSGVVNPNTKMKLPKPTIPSPRMGKSFSRFKKPKMGLPELAKVPGAMPGTESAERLT
jgi:hypothetical protein